MTFIGFSTVGRGDVYEEPASPCNECEVYEEYDETIDPQVIINNTNITNYTWIEVENERNYRNEYHGRHHRPYPPPAVVPYPPHHYWRPICRIGRVGWSYWFDLWVGNRLYQRSSYAVVLNTYWYLARTGQCIPR